MTMSTTEKGVSVDPASIFPARLQPGDRVLVVSPSGSVAGDATRIEAARARLSKDFGLDVKLSEHALSRDYYNAGPASERAADIMDGFRDPEVRAILCSIGGATAINVIDLLDYDEIAANPKIVAGISDSSTLLNAITAKSGLITYHGFEFLDYAGDRDLTYAEGSLREVLFEGHPRNYRPNPCWRDFEDEITSYRGWRAIRHGEATGKAVGGNSDAVRQLFGTQYLSPLAGNILVIESYRLQKRHLDATFNELRLRGAFDGLAGMIIGYCLGSDAPGSGNERDLGDLALAATDGYDFPIVQIGEIGHQVENLILPLGATVEIRTDPVTLALREPSVSPRATAGAAAK
jgi:muramoyltetrapeptide carboxypeptidase